MKQTMITNKRKVKMDDDEPREYGKMSAKVDKVPKASAKVDKADRARSKKNER